MNFVFIFVQKRISSSFVAAVCGDPATELAARNQQYESAASPPTIFSEGAQHSIECRVGYRWLDGSSLNTMTCFAPLQWTLIAACIRMLVYSYKLHFFQIKLCTYINSKIITNNCYIQKMNQKNNSSHKCNINNPSFNKKHNFK